MSTSILAASLTPALAILLAGSCLAAPAASEPQPVYLTDLRPLWDASRVLRNPHKGWYHHYYDNGTRNYLLKSDADLEQFPGMDHLYIRLSWAHFEPQEGRYDWSWIDDVKDHWVRKGYGLSLRISTCETGEAHATPPWVMAAGAKGSMQKAYRQEVWVPEYGDPIYLAKLDRFLAELARRYDGQPWLRYVDIGLGTWGEGHNFPMLSETVIPIDAVKRHIDIYRSHFDRSVLVLSDDAVHVHGRTPAEEEDLKQYCIARNISWRDDSILTWPGLHNWPDQFNVARPALFEAAWRKLPTVLETSHYHEALRDGAYQTTDAGLVRAYEDMRGSAKLTHATYLGYHGDAARWLADHPQFATEMANLLGYWYFPRAVRTAAVLKAGASHALAFEWENKGTAPAYQRFTLRVKLVGRGAPITLPLANSDNRNWMPGTVAKEHCELTIPADTPAGRYVLLIGLFDTTSSPERPIEIGLQEKLRDADGFYRLIELELR